MNWICIKSQVFLSLLSGTGQKLILKKSNYYNTNHASAGLPNKGLRKKLKMKHWVLPGSPSYKMVNLS